MEATTSNPRPHRGGGFHVNGAADRGRRGHPHVSKNKTWVSDSVATSRSQSNTPTHLGVDEAEKRDRGGQRGGRGRGRGRGGRESRSPRPLTPTSQVEDEGGATDADSTGYTDVEVDEEEPVLETPEEMSKFYQEVSTLVLCLRRWRLCEATLCVNVAPQTPTSVMPFMVRGFEYIVSRRPFKLNQTSLFQNPSYLVSCVHVCIELMICVARYSLSRLAKWRSARRSQKAR